MRRLEETEISRAILAAYHEKLADRLVSDVLIVGAGPSGLTAAYYLARQGLKVTLLEKRLSPGGGIWGGGMGLNQAAVQDEVLPVLDEMGIRHEACGEGLHTVDTIELATALCVRAIQSGALLFNLLTAEDVMAHGGRVTGVVVNRTMISGVLPVDPITFAARAVVDATGHEAVVVATLKKRRLMPDSAGAEYRGEGPMDATAGEAFVVDNVAEVYPGLWVSGMSVCATLGGPRMGPIFGGMVLSGKRVAELIAAELK